MARYTDPDTWKTGSGKQYLLANCAEIDVSDTVPLDPMTLEQWSYIRDMTIRLGLSAQVHVPHTTKAQAAKVIIRLRAQVKRMRHNMW